MRIKKFKENMKNYHQILEEVREILETDVFDDYDYKDFVIGVGWEMELVTNRISHNGRESVMIIHHPKLGDFSTDLSRSILRKIPRSEDIIKEKSRSEFMAITIDFPLDLMIRAEYITKMTKSFNGAMKRILSMIELEQYDIGSMIKNEISALDLGEGTILKFPVDWRYPFEQELTILLQEDIEIVRFDILLK